MEKLISDRENMNRGVKEKLNNPSYNRLSRKIIFLRNSLDMSHQEDLKKLRKEFRKALSERRKYKKFIVNPLWIRLEYVRYADDWLVGIWGPLSYVKSLKQNLKDFLQNLKLDLSEEKTLITNSPLISPLPTHALMFPPLSHIYVYIYEREGGGGGVRGERKALSG